MSKNKLEYLQFDHTETNRVYWGSVPKKNNEKSALAYMNPHDK